MTYSFEQFCADNRKAYDSNNVADLEKIRTNLEQLLQTNPEFVAEHCGPDAEPGVCELYKDEETGFIVYAHNFKQGRTSPPHDHGASWAVYGQAKMFTDMTEYNRLDDGSKKDHAEIEQSKKYRLDPGQVGKFGPHAIHQIHFEDGAAFVRVTGADLFKVDTLTYDPANKAVKTVSSGSAADNSRPAPNAKVA